MKRLIATVTMWLVMLIGVHAGGGVQYLQEHHEEQKIIVMDMKASKVNEMSVPDGWHVADIVMASYGHGYAVVVIVLERNH